MQGNTNMKCPNCQKESRPEAKFCEECGTRIHISCPNCGCLISATSKFCGECGTRLQEVETKEVKEVPSQDIQGQRKHITVLFSDLSGYTAMSENMDPEEVKEIMSRIFGEIAQVVAKYDGHIEKFIGDEVMIVFGIPRSHEDDPVRAIRTAQEIHLIVEKMSSRYQTRIGHILGCLWKRQRPLARNHRSFAKPSKRFEDDLLVFEQGRRGAIQVVTRGPRRNHHRDRFRLYCRKHYRTGYR